MAAVATPVENAADLVGKLTLEPSTKTTDAPEYGANNVKEGLNAPKPTTPPIKDYIYYGGYDASGNKMEGYSRYVNPEGVEMPQLGIYGDLYHNGYGYGLYSPYPSPGSPVPSIGQDGQLYAPSYTATYYQPPMPPTGTYTPNSAPTSQGEVSTSVAANQPTISVDSSKLESNGIATNGRSGSAPSKKSQQNSSLSSNGSYSHEFPTGVHQSSFYKDARYAYPGIQSPLSWYDGSMFHGGQHRQYTNNGFSTVPHISNNSTHSRNQNVRHFPQLMRPMTGAAPGLLSRMYPNNQMYPQYGAAFRAGLSSGSSFYDSRENGRWVISEDKYKLRGQGNRLYGYGNENTDGLSELNRGPRASRFKNQKGFGSTVTVSVNEPCISTNGSIEDSSTKNGNDLYNRSDFTVEYTDAKFFVIKSYSEDDVHRSIKYGVWASTPNGNKKLNAAYQEAQEKNSGCPIFLLFSVNTSGQFVGMAEMVGPVDFDKTVDYWQQDKWTGCFPVKWHIVKDVPNNILKHITLENNDNKPVTNSRDTQEVKLEQGLQMLKLFKEHVSKTSILEDFGFYENRQKAIQEIRAKQKLFQKQVANLTLNALVDQEKDRATENPRLHKPLESVTVVKTEAKQVPLVERKPSVENVANVVATGVESINITRPVTEK